MKYLAPAKVNLGLYITDKRSNGYHELASIFLPISLYDELDIIPDKKTNDVDIVTSGSFAFDVEKTKHTVYKAYVAIKEYCKIDYGFKVEIKKNIPFQAGLGGGSSDAASFILACNELLDLRLSQKEMELIGLGVGADVPFFLKKKPCYVEGIGEILSSFDILKDYWVVVAKPLAGLDTARVYSNITLNLTLKSLNAKRKEHLRSLTFQGLKDAGELVGLSNDLEGPSVRMVPQILEVKHFLDKASPLVCMMSGSGSAVFALFDRDPSKTYEAVPEEWFFCTTKVLRGSV